MSRRKIRLCVVGCGNAALCHAQAVRQLPNAQVVAAVDRDIDRAVRFAGQFNVGVTARDMKSVLNMVEVDAVVVALPSHIRSQVVIPALLAGKHVLVEKPMALTVEEADRMIAAAKASGRLLISAQVMRFSDVSRCLRSLIRRGRLGQILQIIHYNVRLIENPNHPWWNSPKLRKGFLIHHHGSHEIDLFTWLMDARITSVYAVSSHPPSHTYDDTVSILMETDTGIPLSYNESFTSRYHRHAEMIVIGTKATARVADIFGIQRLEINEKAVLRDAETMEQGWPKLFLSQMKSFLASVRQGKAKEAGAESVRHSIEVMEAAIRSSKTGRLVCV